MALYGIYGRHTTERCPWNNIDTAKTILGLLERGIERQTQRSKIHKVLGQYHSALEHIFLWIVDADEPPLIQQFCVDEHVASFNELRIVPLITFKEVTEGIRRIHAL